MSLIRIVAVVALAVAAPRPAAACSISGAAAAHVVGNQDGGPVGTQPWFALWMVKDAVKLTRVAASCAANTICRGTAIAFDRTGTYVRPRAALTAGDRVQLTARTRLLADVVVSSDPPADLPAFAGLDLASAKVEQAGLCSPEGPVVRLVAKTKPTTLKGAAFAVYLKKPDPKRPLKNLAYMTAAHEELRLGNPMGGPVWEAGAEQAVGRARRRQWSRRHAVRDQAVGSSSRACALLPSRTPAPCTTHRRRGANFHFDAQRSRGGSSSSMN